MSKQERQRNEINKAINLVLQHRLPEALNQLRAFEERYCIKKSRPKKDKSTSNQPDNGKQEEKV
jgi:hypothetical protein